MAKKVITLIFDHEETFNDVKKMLSDDPNKSKYINLTEENSDGIVINITGTVQELENEE